MEPKGIALSPSTTIRLPTSKLQTSTQSSKGAQRMGAAFELLSGKIQQETNQEGFAEQTSLKAREILMNFRVGSTFKPPVHGRGATMSVQ